MTDIDPTGRVRSATHAAFEEATAHGHDYVGTEHILLGLSRDPAVAATLQALGVSAADLRAGVERAVRPGHAKPAGELPYTSRSKRVFELALAEARQDGNAAMTPEYLLLGLLREDRCIACEILNQLGVTEEKVRSAGTAGG